MNTRAPGGTVAVPSNDFRSFMNVARSAACSPCKVLPLAIDFFTSNRFRFLWVSLRERSKPESREDRKEWFCFKTPVDRSRLPWQTQPKPARQSFTDSRTTGQQFQSKATRPSFS